MEPESPNSVSQWIDHLKAGDNEAAQRLWDRYFERLVQVARRQLGGSPRRDSDEEDLAISVFKSLCHGVARGQYDPLADPNDLWHLLLRITQQKAVDRIRYERRQKRGGGEVRGESVFARVQQSSQNLGLDQIADDDLDPSLLALLEEQHQRLLGRLRNETLRNIALWRMEGFSNQDIADKLGISVRAVERKLQLIRDKWIKELSSQI